MKNYPNAVAIHPYFRVHPGELDTVRASLERFVESTRQEPRCIFYGFTMNGDELFCQEAYEDADAVLTHLQNVGAMLRDLLTRATMTRLEIHGPAEQLARLREPTAGLNPSFFVWQCGL